DDDKPRAKKKPADDDEDDDDKPRAKKKPADDDEDDDDKPRAKKKPADDDEDDDDDSRSSKKKKKAGSPMMMILLLGGGALALLACCGCGIGGWFLFGPGFGPPDVVGRWENNPNDNALKEVVKIEFRADGTGETEILGGLQYFKYEMKGSEMKWTYTHARIGGVKIAAGGIPVRKYVRRSGNTLTLENLDGNMKGQIGVYHKVN
ncbi:MAG: hypothetical protein HYX68_09250, partial [Planctomycetes bacterium]|nr:hypothetical protein [Planctomycetota bacterium]